MILTKPWQLNEDEFVACFINNLGAVRVFMCRSGQTWEDVLRLRHKEIVLDAIDAMELVPHHVCPVWMRSYKQYASVFGDSPVSKEEWEQERSFAKENGWI